MLSEISIIVVLPQKISYGFDIKIYVGEKQMPKNRKLESAKKLVKRANALIERVQSEQGALDLEAPDTRVLEAISFYKRALKGFKHTNSPILNAAKKQLNIFFEAGLGGYTSTTDFYNAIARRKQEIKDKVKIQKAFIRGTTLVEQEDLISAYGVFKDLLKLYGEKDYDEIISARKYVQDLELRFRELQAKHNRRTIAHALQLFLTADASNVAIIPGKGELSSPEFLELLKENGLGVYQKPSEIIHSGNQSLIKAKFNKNRIIIKIYLFQRDNRTTWLKQSGSLLL